MPHAALLSMQAGFRCGLLCPRAQAAKMEEGTPAQPGPPPRTPWRTPQPTFAELATPLTAVPASGWAQQYDAAAPAGEGARAISLQKLYLVLDQAAKEHGGCLLDKGAVRGRKVVADIVTGSGLKPAARMRCWPGCRQHGAVQAAENAGRKESFGLLLARRRWRGGRGNR